MEYRHIRLTRVVVVVAIVILVAVTSWSYVRRISRLNALKKAIPNILPKDAENATVGFTYSKTISGQTIYSIRAWRNLGLKGNRNILEDVEVIVYGKSGNRYDRIHSARADYDQEAGTVAFEGEVDLLLSSKRQEEQSAMLAGQDPHKALANKTQIKTSRLTYSQRENKAQTSAPVQFTFNEISGNAVGLNYDASREHLQLNRDVRMRIERQAGNPPVEITAGSMQYTKESGQIEFTAPAMIRQGDDTLQAQTLLLKLDNNSRAEQAVAMGNPSLLSKSSTSEFTLTAGLMTAKLSPNGKKLETIVAEQNVRAEGRSPTSNSELSAQRLTASFKGRESKLRHMVAEENVVLKILAAQESAGQAANRASRGKGTISMVRPGESKILRAPRMEIALREGGEELESLETPVPGTLEIIPEQAAEDRKIVKGDHFFATFAGDRNTLNSFRATGHVTVDLEPVAPQPNKTHRTTQSDLLTAQFDSATSLLTSIDQSGNFHFLEMELGNAPGEKGKEPIRQATAAKLHYLVAEKVTLLEGAAQVWDATAKTTAQTLRLEDASDTVTAQGNVLTIYQNRKTSVPTPFTNSNSPTFVSADKLVGHPKARKADYIGNARLWQDDDVVKAEEIHLDQNSKMLLASRRVTSTFLTENSDRGKRDFVSVTADSLRYEDTQMRARYEKNVVMQGEMGVLRAPLVDIFLVKDPKPKESRIQRALAQGGVVIVQPQRQATSERAEYFARDEKLILTGNNPTIIDTEKGASTGRELTFFTHDDRILIDGDQQARATTQHKVARQ